MSTDRSPTSKQARFIAEYLKDLNGSEAAVRAGYAISSARHTASHLLRQPHIDAEVRRLKTEQLEKVGVTAEDVLRQLQRIAFFDLSEIYNDQGGLKHPSEWPAPARAALASFDEVTRTSAAAGATVERVAKVRFESRLQALEMLAKHLGLLKDKHEVNNTIVMQWLPPEPLPDRAEVVVIESTANRVLPEEADPWAPGRQEKNGLAEAAPAASDRTHAPRFSDSHGDPSSSIGDELQKSMDATGMSRKALERAFPELKQR